MNTQSTKKWPWYRIVSWVLGFLALGFFVIKRPLIGIVIVMFVVFWNAHFRGVFTPGYNPKTRRVEPPTPKE